MNNLEKFDKLIKKYERNLKEKGIKKYCFFIKRYGIIKVYAKNQKEAIKIIEENLRMNNG